MPSFLTIKHLSVEHVMPQTLTDEWRQHLVDHGEDPTAVHAQLLHTLGNLTLSAYNSELSNNVFDRKQQMYSTSHFELNKALAESPNWTSKEIFARADDLADRVIQTWSGPLSSGEGAPETTDWGRVDAAIALIPPDRTCAVTELAQLVPASPEALLARLRMRSAQHRLDNVLDDRGQSLASVGIPDVRKQASRRPITAYELAQLMPFEFDGEELKVLRRNRSLGAERPRRDSVDGDRVTRAGHGDCRGASRFCRRSEWSGHGRAAGSCGQGWDDRCSPGACCGRADEDR